MKKPHILITNDDGINAPGIFHLWKTLSNIANVTIVAPSFEQSCAGLSVTTRSPLRIERLPWEGAHNAFCVTGTPADCVKLALRFVLESHPDLVVSGINRGSNAGRNVLYSGTVAAAIEASLHDIPAIAFSCSDYVNTDYQMTTDYIPKIVDHVLSHPLTKGTLLNVNFPLKERGINGVKFTKQGREYWGEEPDERFHPVEGHSYYWIGSKMMTFEEEEDSDVSWLQKGYIAAVPVNVGSLTDLQRFTEHQHRFESAFQVR